MKTIILTEINNLQKQLWLNHAIAPRPIAFVSSVDKNNSVNLSPFSYFNIFSINPPILIFSTSIRAKDNSYKDTYLNAKEVDEVVVNICDYDMVYQMSLSSCEFPRGTDEFIKTGFTKEKATLVKPPMVKEAKVKMECRIAEIKSLGNEKGAGQLIICEILCIHIDESVLDADNAMIDQHKLHHVARLGAEWYCRVNNSNIFHVNKPSSQIAIGVDALPENIRNSKILTGNNLGQLANVTTYPEAIRSFTDEYLNTIFQNHSQDPAEMETELHLYAKQLLDTGNVNGAWQVLLADKF